MADRHVSDSDSVSFEEGLEVVHGHRGHRSKYPHTPGPPPPPEASERRSLAVTPAKPRPTTRIQVL